MEYRHKTIKVIALLMVSFLISFKPEEGPKLAILLNRSDVTYLVEEFDNSYGVSKVDNLRFKILNQSDVKYSIEATIEIVPAASQVPRIAEKAYEKKETILIKTKFNTNPSFIIPTRKFHEVVSRIVVTVQSVSYVDKNDNVFELRGDIFYGIEYSFWNRE